MAYNDRAFYKMLEEAESLMRDAYCKGYTDGKAEVENRIRTENEAYKFGLLEGATKYLETKARFAHYYVANNDIARRFGMFPSYFDRDWTMPEHAAKQMLEWGELNPPEHGQEDSDA